MAYIEDYVNGISHDLENVIPKEGHPLVIDSIKEQARRLGNIATHNNKYLVMMMEEFLPMLEERYHMDVPHMQLMQDFGIYLRYGLDAVDHFDDKELENEREI